MCSEQQINLYFEFALGLVKESGKIIREAKNICVETKKDPTDYVTQYDRNVEEILINGLKEKFENHKFISEEECSLRDNIPELTDDPTWIIDPIDGTANFIRKIPISCISLGLVIAKIQTIGIIYNPFTDEFYTAIKGRGAFLNGNRIYTSNKEDIGQCVLNCELSLGIQEGLRDKYLYRLKHLIGAVAGIRSMGCAAMGLCYVANGSMDAYQCDGLFPWDVAAGALIVREAGGFVSDSTGREFDLMNPNFIASATRKLGECCLALMKEADQELLLKDQQQ